MIKDVDKSEVISSHLIQSPVLGPISTKELSGSVDTFIWALDSYYMDETSLLFNNSSFNNTSYLKGYLDLFRTENREETIYNYCYKIYGIESHELVDELIMHRRKIAKYILICICIRDHR